jgi:hypothetical protein
MKAWFENTPDVKENRGNWGGMGYGWPIAGEGRLGQDEGRKFFQRVIVSA